MKTKEITIAEVKEAQREWGAAIVRIGHAEDSAAEAAITVDRLYAYGQGIVLFKPTKATDQPFRPTREGAISYFVGGNPDFPEDHGFAREPWTSVTFDNEGVIPGNPALSMGHYYFTPETKPGVPATPVEVEYTFGYIRDEEGELRIIHHHSSLPYSP